MEGGQQQQEGWYDDEEEEEGWYEDRGEGAEEEEEPTSCLPFVINNAVLGWKLTTPRYQVPATTHTRQQQHPPSRSPSLTGAESQPASQPGQAEEGEMGLPVRLPLSRGLALLLLLLVLCSSNRRKRRLERLWEGLGARADPHRPLPIVPAALMDQPPPPTTSTTPSKKKGAR